MPARSPRAISGAPGPGSPPRPTIDDTYRLALRRQVVGPIAYERQAFPRQRRDHQLALRAVRHDRAARRVDDLGMIVVLPHVDAAARGAVDAEPRPAGLGHADDVEGADAELLLDTRPQLVRPHLRAENADAERQGCEGELLLARRLDHSP